MSRARPKTNGETRMATEEVPRVGNSEVETRFGIGRFRPHGIQCFATIGWFTAIYSVNSLLMTTIIVYVNSQITTLERQFGFTSKQTGLIMAANDIGYLVFVLFASYIAKKVHIPRALGISAIIFGVSGLVCSFPHYFYGSSLNDYAANTDNGTSFTSKETASLQLKEALFGQMCSLENRSSITCTAIKGGNNENTMKSNSQATFASLLIIVIGMSLQGLGKAPRASFSIIYIDDNTQRVKSGFYFGIMVALSILGPAVAFFFGGIFSRIYVTLEDTNLYPKHPRWIGAWWLGFLVFGGAALIFALPLFCFPPKLPRRTKRKSKPIYTGEDKEKGLENGTEELIRNELPEEDTKEQTARTVSDKVDLLAVRSKHDETADGNASHVVIGETLKTKNTFSLASLIKHANVFAASLLRLFKTPVFMCMVVSNCFILFTVGGTGAYAPKYMEQIFDLPAYKANYIMAGKNLFASSVGTFVGGYLTKRLKMTAKKALQFTVCVVAICLTLSLSTLFVYCDQPSIHNRPGMSLVESSAGDNSCFSECRCEDDRYFPVCGADGSTYYSPCMAGCLHQVNGTYSNCSCVDGGTASQGICPYGCDHIYAFAVLSAFRALFGTMAIIPKVTIMIRVVQEKDKSLALGISSFSSSLLGWLLGPVVFGIIIDGICDIWDQKCDVAGRCLLYDNNTFRWKLNGFSSLGIGGSLLFQVVALLYSWRTGCLDDIGVEGRQDEVDVGKVVCLDDIGVEGRQSEVDAGKAILTEKSADVFKKQYHDDVGNNDGRGCGDGGDGGSCDNDGSSGCDDGGRSCVDSGGGQGEGDGGSDGVGGSNDSGGTDGSQIDDAGVGQMAGKSADVYRLTFGNEDDDDSDVDNRKVENDDGGEAVKERQDRKDGKIETENESNDTPKQKFDIDEANGDKNNCNGVGTLDSQNTDHGEDGSGKY